MMTDTWWLNRALIVGIPRRSTEWSTESSCTRVARWISSTTAPERGGPRVGGAGRLVGQQQQRGPEHLALHLQQVRVDLGDQAEVRLDDPAELGPHLVQPGARRAPGCPRASPGIGLGHGVPPFEMARSRSARSMKWMSTASARRSTAAPRAPAPAPRAPARASRAGRSSRRPGRSARPPRAAGSPRPPRTAPCRRRRSRAPPRSAAARRATGAPSGTRRSPRRAGPSP